MNNGRAGDRVFANVDQVLAEKIISRSKENSESAGAPVSMVMPDVDNRIDTDADAAGLRGSMSIAKLLVPAIVALVVFALLIFKRKGK